MKTDIKNILVKQMNSLAHFSKLDKKIAFATSNKEINNNLERVF